MSKPPLTYVNANIVIPKWCRRLIFLCTLAIERTQMGRWTKSVWECYSYIITICGCAPGRNEIRRWFLTGGTRTPWWYQTPKQGVRSTNIFKHTRPENCKDMLSIVVSAVNFVRGQTLNHGLFFVTKFKLKTMFFFTTRKCRYYPVFECLFVFVSCSKKSSSFWDTEVVA